MTIKWKDFLTGTMDANFVKQDDKVREAFDFYCTSNRPCIEMDDLVKVFGSESHAMEIMGAVDLDKDGRISYDEFKNMMTSENKSLFEMDLP